MLVGDILDDRFHIVEVCGGKEAIFDRVTGNLLQVDDLVQMLNDLNFAYEILTEE